VAINGSLAAVPILGAMMQEPIPSEFQGWWRIIETSQWVDDGLDILGTALISLTGYADRLRMHALLAYVNCKPPSLACRSLGRGPGSLTPCRALAG
jgi:hypothetical protein